MSEISSLDILWKKIKSFARINISAIVFDTYIENLQPVDVLGKKLVLRTDNAMFAKLVSTTLSDKLSDAIVKADCGLRDFALMLENGEYCYNGPEDDIAADDYVSVSIDPHFTFDSFVVGKSNDFVFAAAQSVAKAPGANYNPLFIYGGTGLGKTHLLQAIANEILIKKPSLRVVYTTCEKFTNELIDSIFSGKSALSRTRSMQFRARYRNIDVLLIDDIQFLAKKQAAQEEFFHTFNELSSQYKQIVVTSDRPPHEIETLEERLRTRFEGGLTVDVQVPDFETKMAILRRKALEKKCPISDNVLEFLARDSGNDVRTLEGRLNKVIFASKLQESDITVELAARALNQSVSEERETSVSADLIINSVCEYYELNKLELLGKCKKKELVTPRHVCIYLMCDMLNLPLVSIGELIGGRDHTTVIHAREKIKQSIRLNDRMAKEISDIKNIILKQ